MRELSREQALEAVSIFMAQFAKMVDELADSGKVVQLLNAEAEKGINTETLMQNATYEDVLKVIDDETLENVMAAAGVVDALIINMRRQRSLLAFALLMKISSKQKGL